MNNKGFTLVELLAVMVILTAISLVAVGGISSSLEKRDVKECVEQQELAVDAAKIYFSLNENTTDPPEVTIATLESNGYFGKNKKTDRLKDTDKISINEEKTEYLYNNEVVGTSCGEG